MDKLKLLEAFLENKKIFYVERDKFGNIICDDENKVRLYDEMISTNIRGGDNEYYHKGSKSWYKLIPISTDCDSQFYFFEDITEYKEKERELQIDHLTTLMNDRNVANKRMNEYISFAFENDEEFALVIGDIDYFKVINDTYGHDCGDFILQNVGPLLLKMTRQSDDVFDYRQSDIVTRFGGDEFVLLLKNVSENDAKRRILEIKDAIRNLNLEYDNKVIPVEMSFGFYHTDNHLGYENDVESVRKLLFKKADSSLYSNKKRR